MNSTKTFKESPEDYTNYGALKTAKLINIIGLVLNILFILFIAGFIALIGWDVLESQDPELMQEKINDLMN